MGGRNYEAYLFYKCRTESVDYSSADTIIGNTRLRRPAAERDAAKARMIIGYVEQRKDTLIRIALAAAKRQQNFFMGKGRLRPMRMSDIASDICLHEYTVSRAVSGK